MEILDAVMNFAISTITVAPSPADSGTTVNVADPDRFHDPATVGQYNVTIYPSMEVAIPENGEIVRVTAKSGSTLTIVREQEGTTAREIEVGDRIVNAVTKKMMEDIDTELDSLDARALDLEETKADGWIEAGETWVYASTDTPVKTYTFTIAGVDRTTKYYPGMRVKLTQTTVKYFIITKVAFSTNTTVTIYGGSDYSLITPDAITSPYYSREYAPAGFPLSPNKWRSTITLTGVTQNPVTQNTWYNNVNNKITVPLGLFRIGYYVTYGGDRGASGGMNVQFTLSTGSTTENDPTMSSRCITVGTVNVESAAKEKIIDSAAKTDYYANVRTISTSIGNLYIEPDNGTLYYESAFI